MTKSIFSFGKIFVDYQKDTTWMRHEIEICSTKFLPVAFYYVLASLFDTPTMRGGLTSYIGGIAILHNQGI